MRPSEALHIHRDAIRRIVEAHHARNPRVFGSVLRGDDTDETTFLQNELTQDAVVRNIEIIGEASHNIEARFPEFAAAHHELPLSFAYQMRNAVAHGYFTVDMEIVWRTIRDDLPRLRTQVNKAIEALKRETQN